MEWYTELAQEYGMKYFAAQRKDGEEWVIKSVMARIIPIEETIMFDSCVLCEMGEYEFAVFRASQWEAERPLLYLDCRDKTNAPIPNSLGMWLVNQADAGYL